VHGLISWISASRFLSPTSLKSAFFIALPLRFLSPGQEDLKITAKDGIPVLSSHCSNSGLCSFCPSGTVDTNRPQRTADKGFNEKNTMPTSPLVQLDQVSFAYPGGKNILQQVNLSLTHNQRLGLIGPNGSGKTTLLHLLMGLHRPTAGNLLFQGQPVKSRKVLKELRKNIGLVFQDADDQLFSPTVIEDVAFGPLNLGKSPEQALEISNQTLKDLGLLELANRVTHQLSGGEKKLVSLATVLSMQPEAMLLDEPTNNLDNKIREQLIEILNELNIAYMIISHDWDFLKKTCSSLSLLNQGQIKESNIASLHQHQA
jgi:cobalt/nickel transport system ATP-binding protein